MLSFSWTPVHGISPKSFGLVVAFILLLGAATTEAQVPISFGQTISSSLDQPGDLHTYSFAVSSGEVNDDGKISLEEVIHILQKRALLRE